MRILGLQLLDDFKSPTPMRGGPLDAWQDEVARETWQMPQDIKPRYRSSADSWPTTG